MWKPTGSLHFRCQNVHKRARQHTHTHTGNAPAVLLNHRHLVLLCSILRIWACPTYTHAAVVQFRVPFLYGKKIKKIKAALTTWIRVLSVIDLPQQTNDWHTISVCSPSVHVASMMYHVPIGPRTQFETQEALRPCATTHKYIVEYIGMCCVHAYRSAGASWPASYFIQYVQERHQSPAALSCCPPPPAGRLFISSTGASGGMATHTTCPQDPRHTCPTWWQPVNCPAEPPMLSPHPGIISGPDETFLREWDHETETGAATCSSTHPPPAFSQCAPARPASRRKSLGAEALNHASSSSPTPRSLPLRAFVTPGPLLAGTGRAP
jgi:hypothetical protein